jgi:hypothetical protein
MSYANITNVSVACTARPPDFTMAISPSQVVTPLGTTSPPLVISTVAVNGFAGNIMLTWSGVPAGVTVQPASPVGLVAGQKQAVTFSVPASSAIGSFTLQIMATSVHTSQTVTAGLTINPVIKTSEDATMIYLNAQAGTDVARVGLLKAWGGAITEVSLNGVNYVNHDDPGRQIQTSLWDANVDYTVTWGWNPIEAGDHFFNGSPLLAYTLQTDSIYTKTQPIQWAPENFGGGTGPVRGEAYIEKTLSVVPGYNRVFRVHYTITYFGTVTRADATQELPVMYVNPNVPNFVYYSGNAPWTNGALDNISMPTTCCRIVSTTEKWGAYVDATNTGIALYTPMQYPDSKGFNAGSTLQFTPTCPYSWAPNAVLEFDTFILVGSVADSRAAIYALHGQQTTPNPLPPFGNLDVPASGDTMSGNPPNANILGWAWALSGIASVDVLVDGARVGSATTETSRPDVGMTWIGAPTDVGFQYTLDTRAFSNGPHAIVVTATDSAGHVATYATKTVTVSN